MSFGRLRLQKTEEGQFELHRYCVKDGYTIVGGANKLLKAFEREYNPTYIRSYSDNDYFVGGIYDAAQLQSLRVHAACYLHGHSVGGTNPSLLEALACGNWVIAHDNPYNREVARDAAEYFRTPEQLARSLDELFRHGAARQALRAQRARAVVSEHYTWEGISDAYEALMRAECRPGNLAGVAQP